MRPNKSVLVSIVFGVLSSCYLVPHYFVFGNPSRYGVVKYLTTQQGLIQNSQKITAHKEKHQKKAGEYNGRNVVRICNQAEHVDVCNKAQKIANSPSELYRRKLCKANKSQRFY